MKQAIPLALIGVLLVVYSFVYSNSVAVPAPNSPAAITDHQPGRLAGTSPATATNVSLAASEVR